MEIRSKVASKEYRENFDRTFKSSPKEVVLDDREDALVIKTVDGDLVLRGYADA